jgi:hypothetical protein
MIDESKEDAMEKMLEKLDQIIEEEGGLDQVNQMAYDMISWLLHDSDPPEIESL